MAFIIGRSWPALAMAAATYSVTESFDRMSTAVHTVIVYIERFVASALAYIAPRRPAFALEGWTDLAPGAGSPLSPYLQNSLRHEAHIPHRAAPRHI